MNPPTPVRIALKICGFLALVSLVDPCHAEPSPLAQLDIMQNTFPKAFYFRNSETIGSRLGDRQDINYDDWSRELERLDGMEGKAFTEENPGTSPQLPELMNRFAREHPKQMVLLHFNGEGMDIDRFMPGRFSPCDFLYYQGCRVQNKLSATDTEIHVPNTKLFATGIEGYNDDILLVERDQNGKWLWDTAEYVYLKKKSTKTGPGVLTVERCQHKTTAHAFDSDNVWAAPLVDQGPWGKSGARLLWNYNFSRLCPTDKNGQNASQVLTDIIADWFKPGGPCDHFTGIEFDIASWIPHNGTRGYGRRVVDINDDGVGDDGVIDGVNVYGRGVYDFYEALRKQLGKDRLIAADGGVRTSERAMTLLNGMEAEGFCSPGDWAFGDWSSAINRFTYWGGHCFQPPISYINIKDKGPEKGLAARTRLNIAVGCGLGVPVDTLPLPEPLQAAYPRIPLWDEISCGKANRFHWLGHATGPMKNMAFDMPDLLQGAGEHADETFRQKWTSDKSVSIEDNALVLSGEVAPGGSMKMQLPGVKINTTDIVVFCKIKATQVPDFPPGVPRLIKVRLLGADAAKYPAGGEGGMGEKGNWVDQWAYAGPDNYCDACFYFRGPGNHTVSLQIEAEGGGKVWIKDLTVHQGIPAFCRPFEHGVVLGNPSQKSPFDFNLDKLFPGRKLSRLDGNYPSTRDVNNGQPATGTITIPPLDGLFLVDQSAK